MRWITRFSYVTWLISWQEWRGEYTAQLICNNQYCFLFIKFYFSHNRRKKSNLIGEKLRVCECELSHSFSNGWVTLCRHLQCHRDKINSIEDYWGPTDTLTHAGAFSKDCKQYRYTLVHKHEGDDYVRLNWTLLTMQSAVRATKFRELWQLSFLSFCSLCNRGTSPRCQKLSN